MKKQHSMHAEHSLLRPIVYVILSSIVFTILFFSTLFSSLVGILVGIVAVLFDTCGRITSGSRNFLRASLSSWHLFTSLLGAMPVGIVLTFLRSIKNHG